MRVFGSLVVLLPVLAACGESSDKDDTPTPPDVSFINRVPIPDSAFKADAIEAAVDDLIVELEKVNQQSMQVGVVLKELITYWQPVALGANRALGELGLAGSVVAPSGSGVDEQTDRQEEIVSGQIASNYKGLALAPLGEDLTDEIGAAATAGVPVITIDSDLPSSQRDLYIGTLNYEGGYFAGETLAGLLGSNKGTVVIHGNDGDIVPGWIDGTNRTNGARDALEAAGHTVVIVHVSDWTNSEIDIAAMETALTSADPAAVGMMGMFDNAWRCADAAVNVNMVDDLQIVAFDFNPATQEHMQDGRIQATHVQRQYYMGYLAPYLVYAYNVLGEAKTKEVFSEIIVDGEFVNTGLTVIRGDQLELYNDYLDSLGIFN